MTWDNLISRGVWTIIQPSNFLFIIMASAYILYQISDSASKTKRISQRILTTTIVILAFIGFTNLSYWLYFPLESRFDNYKNQTDKGPYSGIIVLAGSEKTSLSTFHSQPILSNDSERLIAAVALARIFPTLPMIHSGRGGWINADEWSQNDVAERFFIQMEIKSSQIRYDRSSYNTSSNAIEAKKLILSGENEKWFLITSAFHMPRSVGAFQKAGIHIQPYPVAYKSLLKYTDFFNFNVSENLLAFDLAIHEYIGLIAYYITGRSNDLFPLLEK